MDNRECQNVISRLYDALKNSDPDKVVINGVEYVRDDDDEGDDPQVDD